ncbi:MAG TPA: glycosyltransferase family 9 protein, partial [Arenibaculum sp.]|nr:glycosyltransferase family 9 protein [Arenibaculum sp.]
MTASILVYSMGEVIGDGLIKMPFVAGLRVAFPDAKISCCAAKGSTVYAGPVKPVVEGLIDEVVVDGATGAGPLDWLPWVKPFGGRTFDLVIDTQENVRRSIVAKRAGRRSVSAAGRNDLPDAVIDRLGALLAEAAPGAKLQPLILTNERALKAAGILLPAGPTYIGLAPGAGGQEKRWPLESYIALAKREEEQGRVPVFFFGPDEDADAAATATALPDALFPEAERTDAYTDIKGPLLVIALASRLAAAVANDAGPGHMLAAGGAPLVSLQKDRRKALKFRPAAQRLEVLIAEDYGGGMDKLPLDSVAEALERLL